MKTINNESGFSIVQVLVAVALMGGLALAMAGLQKKMNDDAQNVRVRNEITTKELELQDYMRNKTVCNENLSRALLAKEDLQVKVSVSDTDVISVPSDGIYQKAFLDSDGNLISDKPILEVGKLFFESRVLVKDVRYDLLNVMNKVPDKNNAYTTEAKLKITVDFERCRNNQAVAWQDDTQSKDVCPENLRWTQSKVFEKYIFLKVDPATNKLATLKKKFKKADGTSAEMEMVDIDCDDSRDALMAEAKDYTDKKFCLLEAKMAASAGKAGPTECGYTVDIREKTLTPENGPFEMPTSILPGSLRLRMVGGGGGGGGGADSQDDKGGWGGAAGEPFDTYLPDIYLGASCSAILGPSGAYGDNGDDGGPGGKTIVKCPALNLDKSVKGGEGGEHKVNNPTNGQDSIFSVGGYAGRKVNNRKDPLREGRPGFKGAGGGGGGYYYGSGGPGGRGYIEISYKTAVITDPEGQIVADTYSSQQDKPTGGADSSPNAGGTSSAGSSNSGTSSAGLLDGGSSSGLLDGGSSSGLLDGGSSGGTSSGNSGTGGNYGYESGDGSTGSGTGGMSSAGLLQ